MNPSEDYLDSDPDPTKKTDPDPTLYNSSITFFLSKYDYNCLVEVI